MNPSPLLARRYVLTGQVQGVGFRPFVYRVANQLGLQGWVRNHPAGAEILAAGARASLTDFEAALRGEVPFPARVERLLVDEHVGPPEQPGFHIEASEHLGEKSATLLPDLATCPACLAEIRDPANRRHRYPFTNCTACGPRYSILLELPYDRAGTTMHAFRMCPACRREYDDPADRRFHAQPNACPVCGPHITLWDAQGRTVARRDDALAETVSHLQRGGIVAVKGLGGFHLMGDATNESAVQELRRRKHREEKPLAVMVADSDTAAALAHVDPVERDWLASPSAPIVLLRKKPSALADAIAPGQPCVGLMLPYTPLQHLLVTDVGRPLVATSGNISDEPMCIDEHEALERLRGIADFFLVHDRPIAQPVDDSVLRVVMGRPLMVRVARGFAPLTLSLSGAVQKETVLAVGAHMKAALALHHGDRIVVSPHIGDLETVPAWQAFERNLDVLERLYETRADRVVCDCHPHYASTHYAERRDPDPLKVQHHHAHILAVMAEHGLEGPVLGIAWDGTGYGDDGTIWGGEVLRVDRAGFTRIAHLRTFDLPGGDSAAREPRRAALGVLRAIGEDSRPVAGFTAAEQAVLARAMARRVNTVTTSSAGRLFDAVAALLGVCPVASHEGRAAMLLQAEAERALHDGAAYPHRVLPGTPAVLDWEPILRGVLDDRDAGVTTGVIAARFHRSLVHLLLDTCSLAPELPVVLAGGCFQNAWLLEHLVRALEQRGRTVWWPQRLPPNDGAIAVGQILAAHWREEHP